MKKLALVVLVGLVASLFALQTSNSGNTDNLSTFAQLYEDTPAGTVLTLTTHDVFYQWTTATVGESRNMTPSAASDNITVLAPGTYLVMASISYLGAINANYHFSLFKSGTEVGFAEGETAVGATATTQNVAFHGIVTAVAGDTLDLRASSSVDTKTATIYHVQFCVQRIF